MTALCACQLLRTGLVAVVGCAIVPGSTGLATGSPPQTQSPTQFWSEVIRNLRDPQPDTRLKALETLNEAGYAAEADDVAPLMADPDVKVRFGAIDAELTFFLNTRIGQAAGDGKVPTRSRAQEAFDAGPLVRNAAVASPAVIEGLVHALSDGAPRVRFDALHALGVIAQPPLAGSDATALAGGLDSSDATTRIATARVLGRLRVASAGDKLIAALNDSNRLEQKYATEALGLIRETRAVSALLARLDFYKSGDLAAETLLALARIASPAAHAVFRAHLEDPDPALRVAALEGLGRLKDASSREAFLTYRDKDGSAAVRLAAVFALGCLGAPDVPALARGLTTADTYGEAVDYLLELGPSVRPGVESALSTAHEGAFEIDLIHVLGFIGTADSIRVLEPLVKDHNDAVAHAASDAVARLRR